MCEFEMQFEFAIREFGMRQIRIHQFANLNCTEFGNANYGELKLKMSGVQFQIARGKIELIQMNSNSQCTDF